MNEPLPAPRQEAGPLHQLLKEFVAEALEHLDTAETALVAAESTGLRSEERGDAMRAMHSIKGAAGYLGLQAIQQLAHAIEAAIQHVGRGTTDTDAHILALLLESTAELRRLVENPQTSADPPSSLLDALQAVAAANAERSDRQPASGPPSLDRIFVQVASQQCQALQAAAQRLAHDAADGTGLEMAQRAISSLASAAEYAGRDDVTGLLAGHSHQAGMMDAESIRCLAQAVERLLEIHEAPRSPAAETASGEGGTEAGQARSQADRIWESRTLRIDQSRVDLLIDQVAELVTIRNQLQHFLGSLEGESCPSRMSKRGKALAFALTRAVDGLHAVAMELRLVRLETVFRRLPRVARDVATRTGKLVRLQAEGGETEIDKGIAEAIADPLMHLVRNAIDHGIEPPSEREAAGKGREGIVLISARRETNQVVVTISDDGRGIDPDGVRAVAVARGLLDREGAQALPVEAVYDLLFQPGFSTLATATEVSGRGFGLDIVRANVCRLGGTVSVSSRSGAGTVVEMHLPVRLAATDVVLVKAGGDTFALPLDAISETLSVPSHELRQVAGLPALVNRGRLVPLLSLAEAVGASPQRSNSAALDSSQTVARDVDKGRSPARRDLGCPQASQRLLDTSLEVVLVNHGTRDLGLIVDEIGQHQQVVVKSLDNYLSTDGINGAAVLADGRVVLVLDPSAMFLTLASWAKSGGPQPAAR